MIAKSSSIANKWHLFFLRVAKASSYLSKDPSSKIGACLAKNRHIISTGYNGFPPNIADNYRLHDRKLKYELIVHAEMNAILQAGTNNTSGSEIYIYGYSAPPCTNCTKHVISAGIKKVVTVGIETPERWRTNFGMSEKLLREAEIEFINYSPQSLENLNNHG